MKHTKLWVGLFCLTLLMLVFWRGGVYVLTTETLYPYERACTLFKRKVWFPVRAALSRVNYASRNALLERDIARLRIQLNEFESLENENFRLRKMLGFSSRFTDFKCHPALVLSRGGTSGIGQTIRVSKGSLNGIRRGDPVIAPEGIVGRISDVAPHTSEVMLISDPNSRIPCELQLPVSTNSPGLIRGVLYGGGSKPGADPKLRLLYVVEPLRLRYMKRDFEPLAMTRVHTSGLAHAFPKGLPVGYLLESRLEEGKLSREADIMPAVDLAGLQEVFILSREGNDAY